MHHKLILHPGEIYFGKEYQVLSTLLGSCVAVSLWHPPKKLVGMCHVLLSSEKNVENDYRYANSAIKFFYQQVKKYRSSPADYQVEIYGGGNMFPNFMTESANTVGTKNIDQVRHHLNKYDFSISKSDLGGEQARKLSIDQATGETLLEYVKAAI